MVTLTTALASPWETIIIFATMLGIVCHQTIRPFEVDSHGWEMIITFLSVLSGLVVGYVVSAEFDLADALLRASCAALAFLTGLYGSILIYRAFFHRLRGFSGPFTARLSKLYHFVYMSGTNMQYHLHLQGLNTRYGDFVRTGPRELTIMRASAVDLIYGPTSKCTKSTWYDQNSGNADKVGIENVRDKAKHGTRRRVWDKALGFRALPTYESRVKDKVDRLMTRFSTGKPLNVTQENVFYAWDVMGDIAFSTQFDMLSTGVQHSAVDGLHWAMATAGLITTLPWLMNMLRVIPGATGKFEQFASWCYEQLRLKQHQLASEKSTGETEQRDVMSWLIQAQQRGDRAAPPTESAIREDARTLISAGSDTVAIAFTNCLYFLAKNPPAYSKLRHVVSDEFPSGYSSWTYEKAKGIRYIDHLIHETLRLRPPVPMGFLRETPPEGLQIDEVFVPGNVNVNVPIWAIHRDERYFPRAAEFIPERWQTLSPESSASAYMPFQRGGFACVGKAMAMMQLRMLISCLALRYQAISFAPGDDGEGFWNEAKETMTLWLPPLQLAFESVDQGTTAATT
ncbi:hypothetical protein KVR01_006223 [Diaporthe batatas]|uniref:uncharacterized protein n=1 Tax=Diaporthe batatas TaxID=748121 RepID=UPI001D057ACA|nr:uncharacterized protein KVR01_006223 [Diaporthe batatas]KAG8164305.1 hypothetical protein KVR01_006223 [Diaporthe batatas]